MPSDTGGALRGSWADGGRNQSAQTKFTKSCGSKLHNQQHDDHELERVHRDVMLIECDCWSLSELILISWCCSHRSATQPPWFIIISKKKEIIGTVLPIFCWYVQFNHHFWSRCTTFLVNRKLMVTFEISALFPLSSLWLSEGWARRQTWSWGALQYLWVSKEHPFSCRPQHTVWTCGCCHFPSWLFGEEFHSQTNHIIFSLTPVHCGHMKFFALQTILLVNETHN